MKTPSPTTLTPLRELKRGDYLNDGSANPPEDRLYVYVDPQHIGHDHYILDVKNRNGHRTSFTILPGGTRCQLENKQ